MSNIKLTIIKGNILEKIKEIPNESIDLCITSPPYWALRDYGVEGQLGLEPSMEDYLDNMMKWVREVYRVLKPTGNFILNIGDCFIGGGRGGYTSETTCMEKVNKSVPKPPSWKELKEKGTTDWKARSTPISVVGNGCGIYKKKQLLSVSSFAYCRIISETDFVCRGEHVWCKPNTPTPVRSRLKHSHEKLFWFVKDSDKYFFDNSAWLKKLSSSSKERIKYPMKSLPCGLNGKRLLDENEACTVARNENTIEHSWRIITIGEKQNGFELLDKKPSNEHIAPFPTKLIEPYIKSMCPVGGVVLDPFLGSGTTMRVAMENSRSCIGIELNPNYIEYTKKRLNWGAGLNIDYDLRE